MSTEVDNSGTKVFAIFVVFVLAVLLGFMWYNGKREQSQPTVQTTTIPTISEQMQEHYSTEYYQKCEYICINGVIQTHKGNCSNPIHKIRDTIYINIANELKLRR